MSTIDQLDLFMPELAEIELKLRELSSILGPHRINFDLPQEEWVKFVAHSLSNQCRYGGHTSRFYSVAEHAWLTSYLPDDPVDQFRCLHHDDTEAYIPDMQYPLKIRLPQYLEWENAIEHSVAKKLGISPLINQEVNKWDRAICIMENAELKAVHHSIFEKIIKDTPKDVLEKIKDTVRIIGLKPSDIAFKFYQRHEYLSRKIFR